MIGKSFAQTRYEFKGTERLQCFAHLSHFSVLCPPFFSSATFCFDKRYQLHTGSYEDSKAVKDYSSLKLLKQHTAKVEATAAQLDATRRNLTTAEEQEDFDLCEVCEVKKTFRWPV